MPGGSPSKRQSFVRRLARGMGQVALNTRENVMAKNIRMVIRIAVNEVAIGHRQHASGGGAHGDKRTKRHKTRGNRNRAAVKEWS